MRDNFANACLNIILLLIGLFVAQSKNNNNNFVVIFQKPQKHNNEIRETFIANGYLREFTCAKRNFHGAQKNIANIMVMLLFVVV